MKPFAAVVFLFAVAVLALPELTAQNKDDDKKVEKKDAKDEKKAVDKKGDVKKDEKKEEKKDDKKEEKSKSGKAKTIDPEEEKLLNPKETFKLRARIQMMDPNTSGEFTVQLPYPYPAKMATIRQWYAQQIQLKTPIIGIMTEYKQKMSQANQIDVRTGANMKVRTAFPPVEYDAKGNLKRWTPKEIAALRGGTRLPGYPAQMDALRTGQIVDLYCAVVPAKKTTAKEAREKKKMVDDDPDDSLLKPEVLMVVVVLEAPQR
jgi:hypothetical protein